MEAKALYELMAARRSCRAYGAQQVEAELLEQVLQAGQMAPSGKNVQQSHYIVLRRPELLERVRVLVQQLVAATEPAANDQMAMRLATLAKEGKLNFFHGAPTLIVVANRRDNPNNVADCAAALQNMMLMATALGLGNCWINQLRWLGEAPPLRAFLDEIGVKDDEAVYGGLALGYSQVDLQGALPRTGNTVEIIK